jgi:predicted AlkP superfamily phosphohydrolase/phosphomutase
MHIFYKHKLYSGIGLIPLIKTKSLGFGVQMTIIFILGLDCATPQLVFDKYLAKLPTISGLIKNGKYGLLESSIPPVTVPAWMSMMTGKDPGQLGFFGFTDRDNYSYKVNKIVTHSEVKAKTLWDYAGEAGLTSIVLNVPQTYPPRAINGIMVASFLTPDKLLKYTYPQEISEEIDTIADGNYIIDVENFRTDDKKKLLAQIYEMTEKRFEIIKNFIKNKEWDLFIAVEMGIDRLHHGFWSYCFEDHRLYEEGNEFKNVIFEYYQYIDKKLAELIETFDEETELIIASDHGAKNLQGTFCINDWLMKNGYLKFKSNITEKTKFNVEDVDWDNTIAWGDGGYYGKIYFNVKGREKNGYISKNQVKDLKTKLTAELATIEGPEKEQIENRVIDTEALYHELNGCPPDLVILIGNLDWRVTNSIGNEKLFIYESTHIDNSNHDMNGIVIYSKNPKSALGKNEPVDVDVGSQNQYSIIDITPTVLNRLKIEIPNDLHGKIIE